MAQKQHYVRTAGTIVQREVDSISLCQKIEIERAYSSPAKHGHFDNTSRSSLIFRVENASCFNIKVILVLLFILGSLIYSTSSLPTANFSFNYDKISDGEAISSTADNCTSNDRLENKKLRILPLGDSITNGFRSSNGNGYREDLWNILTAANNSVEMIGSLRSGSMTNNENEGHNGATIHQIASFTSAYRQRPNVILLHAGTNDMNLPLDPDSAPQRLDSLVGNLVSACPDATIFVARIILSTNDGTSTLIPLYNEAITELMAKRVINGQHVMVVDMYSGVHIGDLSDGLHPNDEGYNKMAIKWAIALTAADLNGWISDPVIGSGNAIT